MLITSFKIENYKSFLSSDEVHLLPGFNVIIGENNSGKTSFLEALSLNFESKPYKDIKTVPYPGAILYTPSSITVSFTLSQQEIRDITVDKAPQFMVPVTNAFSEDVTRKHFSDWFSNNRTITFTYQPNNYVAAYLEGLNYEPDNISGLEFSANRHEVLPRFIQRYGNIKWQANGNLPIILANALKERIYAFRAERFHVGQCEFGDRNNLLPDASNLPEVLNYLQGLSQFNSFNLLVQQVFPQIARISIRPIENKRLKIFILSSSGSQRDDLAVPLQDSGTGIGQVLAILYVVFTASHPRVIIIDEPQSFLHPGAIRRLFDILKQYPQHQYIVSSHSPIVITATDPQKILLIRKRNSESAIEIIDKAKKEQLEIVLREVGVKLSDFFGSDSVLWVEGDTEELCFPLIFSQIIKQPLLGTVILGVLAPGDFEGKHSKTIFNIYSKLSKGQGLLPPAIGFIFDREKRDDTQRDGLIRQSKVDNNNKQTVFFTSRRMYENYLLNPAAIAAVISSSEGASETINVEAIQGWLEEHRWSKTYFKQERLPREDQRTNEWWCEKVHGARLLQDLFEQFLIGNTYDKKEHGLAITKWIIKNSPEDLNEIVDLLKQVLSLSNTINMAQEERLH